MRTDPSGAGIQRTDHLVGAIHGDSTASTAAADVADRAGVSVVAGNGVIAVLATVYRMASVRCAGILVAAVPICSAPAGASEALIDLRAHAVVVARVIIIDKKAAKLRVTAIVCADVAVAAYSRPAAGA